MKQTTTRSLVPTSAKPYWDYQWMNYRGRDHLLGQISGNSQNNAKVYVDAHSSHLGIGKLVSMQRKRLTLLAGNVLKNRVNGIKMSNM